MNPCPDFLLWLLHFLCMCTEMRTPSLEVKRPIELCPPPPLSNINIGVTAVQDSPLKGLHKEMRILCTRTIIESVGGGDCGGRGRNETVVWEGARTH